MRRVRLNGSLALALALVWTAGACGPDEDEVPAADTTGAVEAVPEDPSPTSDDRREAPPPGVIRGVVRGAQSGDPLVGALVSAGDFGATSDASGGYALPPLPPGSVMLRAYRRGFVPESVEVVVNSGELTVTDLSLDASAGPCCELEGDWSAQFTLDSAGLGSRPSARSLEGGLSFEADDDADTAELGNRVARSSGSSDLDFGPLLGSDVGAVGELAGMAFSHDSVAITLLPRFGDWAIELRGLQSADSIRGRWFQRASCCGAYGSFLLTRDESPGAGRGSG